MSFNLLAANSPLQSTLRKTPTTAAFLRMVIREIWNQEFTPDQHREYRQLYGSYFAHIYEELCTVACSGDSQIPNLTHCQILEAVQNLKSHSCTKSEAARAFYLSTGCTDEDRVTRAITLAAGLLVPLNFKSAGGARRGELVSWGRWGLFMRNSRKGSLFNDEGILVAKQQLHVVQLYVDFF